MTHYFLLLRVFVMLSSHLSAARPVLRLALACALTGTLVGCGSGDRTAVSAPQPTQAGKRRIGGISVVLRMLRVMEQWRDGQRMSFCFLATA